MSSIEIVLGPLLLLLVLAVPLLLTRERTRRRRAQERAYSEIVETYAADTADVAFDRLNQNLLLRDIESEVRARRR